MDCPLCLGVWLYAVVHHGLEESIFPWEPSVKLVGHLFLLTTAQTLLLKPSSHTAFHGFDFLFS